MAPTNPGEEDELFTIVTSRRRHKSSEKKHPIYIMPPRQQVKYPSTRDSKRRQKPRTSPSEKYNNLTQQPMKKQVKRTYTSDQEKTPLTARGAKEGLLLESIIIEYFLSQVKPTLFLTKQEGKAAGFAKKIHFSHKHGDPFLFLNVAREWVHHLTKGDSKEWCSEWNINELVLEDMESYVLRRYSELRIPNTLKLKFNEDLDESDSKLMAILLELFVDGLCVYRGHPELGYWSVSKWRTVHISSSSILRDIRISNQFILVLEDTSNVDVIHNAIPLDASTGQSLLDENFKGASEMLPLMMAIPVRLNGIGEVVKERLIERIQVHGDKGLQQRILNNCEGNIFILQSPQNNSIERNNLTVFVSKLDHDVTLDLLEKAKEEIRAEDLKQCSEFPYPNEESAARVLLSAGGAVTKVLLPHEYRSILIYETHTTGLTKDDVARTLSVFGEIESIIQYNTTGKTKTDIWGEVVFKDPSTVQAVLSSHAILENMLVELKPLSNAEACPLYTFDQRVHMTVRICRRPFLSGKASVLFSTKRNYSRATDAPPFYVGGTKVRLKPTGRGWFLVDGLDMSTHEEDLCDGLKTIGLQPDEVNVHRQPPFRCMAGELEKFKSALKRILDKATDLRKVSINIKTANDDDMYLCANVVFANHRIATSALDCLSHAKINNLPLLVQEREPLKTAMVQIRPELYVLLEEDLARIVKNAKRRYGVDVHIHSLSNVEIHISHIIPQKVDATLELLQEVLAPKVITVSKGKYYNLTRSDGQHLLHAVKAQTKTLICWDKSKLMFYGPAQEKSEAVQLFKEYDANKHKWFKLSLSELFDSSSVAYECVAALTKKYGASFRNLKEEGNFPNIVFDIDSSSLLASSLHNDAKESFIAVVQDCFSNCVGLKDEVEPLPDCCACFSEPPSKDEMYLLEACGHVYCTECAYQLAKHTINARQFPVVCAQENCGQAICIPDLLILTDLAFKDGRKHFTKLTTDTFCAINKDTLCFCPMPYCQGLVPKDKRFHVYYCLECYAKVCTKCFSQAHQGNCEEFHDKKALQRWFDSSVDRKHCPKCKTGIEKVDGCNRVCCVACLQHICWVCLAYFADRTACYDHMDKEHGGY